MLVVTHVYLRLKGFQFHLDPVISFYHRPAQSKASHNAVCGRLAAPQVLKPLVFMHGIGLGLFPYISFIAMMPHDRPVFLPLFQHVNITMANTSDIAPTRDIVNALVKMLEGNCEHNTPAEPRGAKSSKAIFGAKSGNAVGTSAIKQAVSGKESGFTIMTPTAASPVDTAIVSTSEVCADFIGHSYGTFYLASLVRHCPSAVNRAVFVDPVCFLLCQHSIVYNFLYRQPPPFVRFVSELPKHKDWVRKIVHYFYDLALVHVVSKDFSIQKVGVPVLKSNSKFLDFVFFFCFLID
jgi:hypothetical protein